MYFLSTLLIIIFVTVVKAEVLFEIDKVQPFWPVEYWGIFDPSVFAPGNKVTIDISLVEPVDNVEMQLNLIYMESPFPTPPWFHYTFGSSFQETFYLPTNAGGTVPYAMILQNISPNVGLDDFANINIKIKIEGPGSESSVQTVVQAADNLEGLTSGWNENILLICTALMATLLITVLLVCCKMLFQKIKKDNNEYDPLFNINNIDSVII